MAPAHATLHWNLGTAALYEEAVRNGEGVLAETGPLVCLTTPHTGRSPNDRFLVDEPSTSGRRSGGGRSTAPSTRRDST